MNLLQRLRNLWALSNFVITEFDNKLVITKKDDKLVVVPYEKPKMAKIIKRTSPSEEFLKQDDI